MGRNDSTVDLFRVNCFMIRSVRDEVAQIIMTSANNRQNTWSPFIARSLAAIETRETIFALCKPLLSNSKTSLKTFVTLLSSYFVLMIVSLRSVSQHHDCGQYLLCIFLFL